MPINSLSPTRRRFLAGVVGLISVAAPVGAIALATAAVHAHELEQVNTVFEHAIPNIAGRSLVTLVVDYPPGGKSPSHRHAGSAFIYANVWPNERIPREHFRFIALV